MHRVLIGASLEQHAPADFVAASRVVERAGLGSPSARAFGRVSVVARVMRRDCDLQLSCQSSTQADQRSGAHEALLSDLRNDAVLGALRSANHAGDAAERGAPPHMLE